MVTLTVFKT